MHGLVETQYRADDPCDLLHQRTLTTSTTVNPRVCLAYVQEPLNVPVARLVTQIDLHAEAVNFHDLNVFEPTQELPSPIKIMWGLVVEPPLQGGYQGAQA